MQDLIFSIFDYEIDQKIPNFNNNVRLDTIFEFIKDDLDKNRSNYDRRCETSRWNGLFGGRPRKNIEEPQNNENLKKPKKPKKANRYDMTDMIDMTDIKKENIKKEKSDKRKDNDSNKIHYGTYKHVLLTEKEFESLNHTYHNHTPHIIQFLDDYIEEKGYKSKSHYLTIKRWVVQAYRDKLQKIAKAKILDGDPIPSWFNQEFENRPLSLEEEQELDNILKEFS